MLRRLIEEDAAAYSNLTAATRAGAADEQGKADQQAAVILAMNVPLEMAAVASEALAAMEKFKTIASRYLLSDLAVAAVLAEATARAAFYSVRVNARQLNDVTVRASLLDQMSRIVDHADSSRRAIEAYVNDYLNRH